MSLDAIPTGTRVLIDTNILIYARRAMSAQCRPLLELAIESIDFLKAAQLLQSHGLLANDSLSLAAGLRSGINLVATADPQFDLIAGVTVFKPNDL